MPKVKWSKVPWASIAEFVLAWWQSRKKDDKGQTGRPVQSDDDKPPMDNGTTRPIK